VWFVWFVVKYRACGAQSLTRSAPIRVRPPFNRAPRGIWPVVFTAQRSYP
jgi:hypothetical protein